MHAEQMISYVVTVLFYFILCTVQHSTVQYSILKYCTVLYSTVPCCAHPVVWAVKLM